MARRGKRRTIATRVYDDDTGRVITYDHPVTGKQREIRRPPMTPIVELRKAAAKEIARLSGSGRADAPKGTLDAGIDEWTPLEQSISSWKERRAELRAWARAMVDGRRVGDMRMAAIDSKIARAVMGQWTTAGVAPKTIRNRRWSLQRLYRVLGGPNAPTPVDDIAPPAKTKTIPQMIEPAHVLAVYANLLQMEAAARHRPVKGLSILRDAKTRARFMVRACTGKRPSEIMRAEPSDVSLQRREWRVRDGKGGWSEGLYLNDDMIVAWQLFIDADAWGPFNTGSQAEVLRHAGWIEGVRPYQLRHSVGMALSDAGVDLADISGVLGHRDLRTARETYVPIRQARMQRASESLEGRFDGWVVPSGVPSSELESVGSVRKSLVSKKPTWHGEKPRKSLVKKGRK